MIIGLFVLALPSIALARAGAAVHLNARSRRYGLLRALGAAPRQLAAVMVSDMAIPVLAGGLVGSVAYAVVTSSLDSFTLRGKLVLGERSLPSVRTRSYPPSCCGHCRAYERPPNDCPRRSRPRRNPAKRAQASIVSLVLLSRRPCGRSPPPCTRPLTRSPLCLRC